MIDKEIEHSMLSNTSTKKQKQQLNKSKLEHEGASAISQTITETREFALFRADVLRRLQSKLVDLVENFDEEFPVTLTSSSSTALGMTSETLTVENGIIAGTSIELSEIAENIHSGTGGAGGGSSAYNVSYGSDSEISFTNGSSGRHVCFKKKFIS
jgi:CRISPR/Cas system CMR subunit Cmr6 (Cas7 group RAMP superfamily)